MDWKKLQENEYLKCTNYQFIDNQQDADLDRLLHISTINTKEVTHTDLLTSKNPHEWMKAHKEHTHVLNADDSNEFDKIFYERLQKYIDYLDQMKDEAANKLSES